MPYFFSDTERRYFDNDLDLALQKPIEASKIPERENVPPGTDPGGYLTSKIVGVTANPTQSQVDALQASIRLGASKVELGFMGTQKGSNNSPTPESMSQREREMIYDLAKLNKIETTVHAAPSVSNLSGYSQNGFSESAREDALNEIRRAIDFAADASTGGAVVIHWDEWQRPIENVYGLGDKNKDNLFQGHTQEYIQKEEKDKNGNVIDRTYGPSQVLFVNTEDDRVQALRRDMEFTEPIINGVNLEKDDQGGKPFLVYEYQDLDENSGEVKTQKVKYDDILEMEKKLNTSEKFKKYQDFADENFEQLRNKWKEIENMPEKTERQVQEKKDAIFLFHFLRKQTDRAYEQYLSADSMYRYHSRFHDEDPKQREDDKERRIMAWTGFQEQLNKLSKMKPIEEHSTNKAAQTVAEAALYAWERSKGNKKLSRNLYVSPESFFPQSYGSHPDEMMEMVDKSREKMAEELVKVGGAKSVEEAKTEAKKYIRTTLDIGHLNMWRRHLKRRENESIENYNKRFNEWAIEKSKEMADKGYIGHAHMSDNFGFGDEHLTVGQGNAPVKEFVEALRKSGNVDDFIVEVGSYNATTAHTDAWSHLGISMGKGSYFQGKEFRMPSYFNQVQHSYAGSARKPSYVFGKFAPIGSSTDKWQPTGWAPWSGSPL